MSADRKSSISEVKAALRAQFRKARESLSDDEYERRSTLIIEEAKQLTEIQSATCVHLYWPIVEQREVDTRLLIRWLEERGKTIVLPRVAIFEGDDARASRLEHIRYPGESRLRVNKWGIAEPPPGEVVPVSKLDAVIVPAIGAGRNGHRIGHGLAYYDEFLASIKAPTIVFVFDNCLVDHVPNEPHDVPVDIVISERAIVRPRRHVT